MDNLSYLLPYVEYGTAEADKQFLNDVFVLPDNFDKLISITPGAMRIVVAHKGVGKSALIEQIYLANKSANINTIILKPQDIVKTLSIRADASLAELKYQYFNVLLQAVIKAISEQLPKFINNKDEKVIYNAATKLDVNNPDFIQNAITLLSSCVSLFSGINLDKIISTLTKEKLTNQSELLNSIENNLKKGDGIFYILIDDTDQITINPTDQELNKIWGLLQAVRELGSHCPSVRTILTLRTSIWNRMNQESKIIQNEQMDHFRSYLFKYFASNEKIKDIYNKRLAKAYYDLDIELRKSNKDIFLSFFDKMDTRLPTSNERRSWDDFLTKSARNRPRDVTQFIKNLIEVAQERRKNELEQFALMPNKLNDIKKQQLKIKDDDIDDAMKQFSRERVEDLAREYNVDCQNLKVILLRFSKLSYDCDSFNIPFDKLIKFIKGMPGGLEITIRNKKSKVDNAEDAIYILSFLHEIGFINPKYSQNNKFKHFLYDEYNDFVSLSNIEKMERCTWEIHPAFRSELIAQQKLFNL